MARLAPDHVLERDPVAEVIHLADGRLLLRHRGGVSVLAGVSLEEVEAVLAQVDGRRSAGEIVQRLAAEHGERRPREILAALAGEVLRRASTPPRPGDAGEAGPRPAAARAATPIHPGSAAAESPIAVGPIVVVGDGAAAVAVAEALATGAPAAGWEVRRMGAAELRPDETLEGAELAICTPQGVPYGTLFRLQAACLRARLPSLFVTFDPDGVRVGPTTVPGRSPCLACAQLAGLAFLRLAPADRLAAAGEMLSTAPGPVPLEAVARAVVGEVGQALDPRGEPRLLDQVLHLPAGGGGRLYGVDRHPACPLCAGVDPGPDPGPVEAPAPTLAARAERRLVVAAEAAPRRPAEREDGVASVGILGGGTAGYLAALALRRKLPHLRVTLLESSAVPIIGVGEATTPLMPQFLHADLGLEVGELFRRVHPTLKLGIRFLWGIPGDGDFNYPFGPVRVLEPALYEGHIRSCSLQSLLMAADAVPVERTGEGWLSRLGTDVAYHLDNERFAAYLRDKAGERGVERVECTIARVEVSDDGEEVRTLVAEDGRRFTFDLYLDCSGFRSLLLGDALGSPFVPFADSLFTDRAVVATVPHGGRIRPYTLAETLEAGWCWSTPQGEADHRGYVFSSAFASDEAAEAEMRRTNPGMAEARVVRFRAGRHQHFWKGNVVALGNAYGFVEPLESTALHMLIRQIGLLLAAFPMSRGAGGAQSLINRKVNAFWDYLKWFLALHYKFNRRLETPFWRASREEVDLSRYGELLEAFRHRGPLSYDRAALAAFDAPDPLWGAEGVDVLLLGQGVPCRLPRPAVGPDAWRRQLQRACAVAARGVPQAEALDAFATHPELLDNLAAAFRAAGPAFPSAG